MKRTISLCLIFAFTFMCIVPNLLLAKALMAPKYSLAVLPFTVKGRLDAGGGVLFGERLHQELSRNEMFTTSNYKTTQNALRDNGLIPSNCGSVECGVQAGKVLGVRLIANGEIRKVGARIFLEARIIHVASGQIIQSINEQYNEGTLEDVIADAPGIAVRLIGQAPGRQTSRPPLEILPPAEEIQQIPAQSQTTGTQPDDVFILGEKSDIPGRQSSLGKKSNPLKWALFGLLVAGGIGAGVLIASRSANDNADGGTTVTTLPGHPKFP